MGALLGGVLTDFLSWRLAFLINVPIAVGITIAAPAVIAEGRHAQRPRLDAPGAVTVTAGLLALVHGSAWPGRMGGVRGRRLAC